MAYCRKSLLELLTEEDKLLKQREDIAKLIVNTLYDREEGPTSEWDEHTKTLEVYRQREAEILSSIENNRRSLRYHILDLFKEVIYK